MSDDLIHRQAVDVHQRAGRLHVELHQIDQRGSAGEERGVRIHELTACELGPDAKYGARHGTDEPNSTAGHRFAILGDMLELGAGAEAAHRALGRAAGTLLAGLCAVGALAPVVIDEARAAGLPAERALVAASPELAAAALGPWTTAGDWILVKASRGLRLERAVEALRKALGPGTERGG